MLLLNHCMYIPQACTEIVPMQTAGQAQWFQSSRANRKGVLSVCSIRILSFCIDNVYINQLYNASVHAYVLT